MPKPFEIYNKNKVTLQTFAIEGGIQLHDSYGNEQTDTTGHVQTDSIQAQLSASH